MLDQWRLFLAFLSRDFRTEISYRLAFLLNLSTILFTTVTYYFVARLLGESVRPLLAPYGGDYFAFALIGVAFASYFTLGLSGFARNLRLAQTTGTLEAMLMTPAPLSMVILGSAAWNYAFTTFRVVAYLLLGVAMGIELQHANYAGALLTLILAITAFASLGIIAASVIMITKRGEPITGLFSGFATLVGGVFYPVEVLPGWLQKIANLIPITHALRAMRLALLEGAPWHALAPDLLALVLFVVILFPLSLLSFRVAVARAKEEGSLAHY